MKLFTSYTDSHIPMMEEFFLPTLPTGIELVKYHVPNIFGGNMVGKDWRKIAIARWEWLVDELNKQEKGSIVLFTDVDIQWFDPDFVSKVPELLGDNDAAYQHDLIREACCGFHIIRCSEQSIAFYELVKNELKRKDFGGLQDQLALNELLPSGIIRYCLLPAHVVWTTRREHGGCFASGIDSIFGYGEPDRHTFVVPNDIMVHHSNWNTNIVTKTEVLHRVREIMIGRFAADGSPASPLN